MKSPSAHIECYEVTSGFWDRCHYRALGETVRMSEPEARTHVFAGCLRKVGAEPVQAPVDAPVEAPSNAG